MGCPDCGSENRDGVRFCTQCGLALGAFCPRCQFSVEAGDRFCGGCGFRMQMGEGSLESYQAVQSNSASQNGLTSHNGQAPTAQSMESERKHVTVLFADISGFTAMSEKLDPEEVTQIMNGCLKMLADVVTHYEGYVDKFIGDCIMALFGAPITHENDPELALRAALDMQQGMLNYNKNLPVKLDKPLTLHIGINTGIVIAGGVGSDQKMEYTVMGDTVNLASRLESKAASGETFISGYTYNMTRSLFEFDRLDPMKVKGKQKPVEVYKLLGLQKGRSEDQKAQVPLVGRTEEMRQLTERVERLIDGKGQVVVLTSEQGFGKSRIRLEVRKQLVDAGMTLLEGACHSFCRSTRYHVIGELLRQLFGVSPDDSDDAGLEKIEAALTSMLDLPPDLNQESARALVYIASLLDLKVDNQRYEIPLDQMDPREVKAETFRAISWLFGSLAKKRPLVITMEDLDNADSASMELLTFLLEDLRAVPAMFLLLLRSGGERDCTKLTTMAKRAWGGDYLELAFTQFSEEECGILIQHLMGSDGIPDEVLSLIMNRTDGNPLFIEEVVQSLFDGQVVEKQSDGSIALLKDLANVSIPGSVHSLILARIDKLQPKLKDLLQMAAVIGNVFRLDLLGAAFPVEDLDQRLRLLEEMGILYEARSFPEVEYSFRNGLIQEAVYATMLKQKVRELHLKVADLTESIYADRIGDYIESLARHLETAQAWDRAYVYLERSGQKAQAAFANVEARGYYLRAVEVAEQHDDVLEAEGAPSLAKLYTHLSEVDELLGEMDGAIEAREHGVTLLTGDLEKASETRLIGRLLEKRGDKDMALQTYDRAVELLADYPDDPEMGRVLTNRSWVLNRMKQSTRAMEEAQTALKIFETHNAREDMALLFNNLSVFCEHSGDLDQALAHNQKSLSMFEELGNVRQQGNVHLSLGYIYNGQRNFDQALIHFDQSFDLMDRIGNRYGAGTALMSKGRCLLDVDKVEEGETALLRALRIHKELNISRKVVANQLALVRLYLRNADHHGARRHLNEAKELARREGFDSDLAKLAQVEGDLLVLEGKDPSEQYQEAISLFGALGRTRDVEKVVKVLDRYRESSGA
ncbi:adenylate/guanylate cyclase domain-containing protein [Magnetococcus sp. PR-3]|uniref:adenylate/guanylate cyclase domain-containing protein n=1 Tax=Magnetococcus sp. PR-3 TaxID=3120355 RepID=UPI002FCE1057